jgi:hypothetical protein
VVLVNLLEVLTGLKVARRDRDFKHDLVREIEVPFSLAVRFLFFFPLCPEARLTLTYSLPFRTCESRWTSSSKTSACAW